ncbi:GNAT family N-acetyltransferase [Halorientalis brevis]|uniref:GNAT family N-acetyltransferase n=1 Tax=Halorientalis brevis TaxID=1126241 RepID=A0ABD6CCC6_9EURY|nr:GNAT family N-acetyltransferase [Halorientalis brevis]
MTGTTLGRRFWWLTRNRHGKRVYEFLAERGIRVSKLERYVRSTGGVETAAVTGPEDVEFTCQQASDVDATAVDAFEEPAATDRILIATDDETVVGYLFLSHDRSVWVDPLETELDVDGAYIWRVFVDPAHRKRGIATALVERAVQEAARLGAGQAIALVAVDNYPSKQVFQANGFRADRVIGYYRLFGLTRRTVREGPR